MTVSVETKTTITVTNDEVSTLVVTIDEEGDFRFEQDNELIFVARADVPDLLDALWDLHEKGK